MGILDKFKKRDSFEDEDDFPDLASVSENRTPSLGPAAFQPPQPAMSPMNPQPQSMSMQQESTTQSKLSAIEAKVDAIRVEVSALMQRLYRIEQLLTQKSQSPQSSPPAYGSQSQSSGSSLPSYAQPPSQRDDEQQNVWPF